MMVSQPTSKAQRAHTPLISSSHVLNNPPWVGKQSSKAAHSSQSIGARGANRLQIARGELTEQSRKRTLPVYSQRPGERASISGPASLAAMGIFAVGVLTLYSGINSLCTWLLNTSSQSNITQGALKIGYFMAGICTLRWLAMRVALPLIFMVANSSAKDKSDAGSEPQKPRKL